MEINGKLKVVNDVRIVSDKFKSREIIVTIDADSEYPQHLSIQLTQDKVDLINQFTIGEDIKLSINLKGKKWISPQGEIKYFNTIEAWKIEAAEAY